MSVGDLNRNVLIKNFFSRYEALLQLLCPQGLENTKMCMNSMYCNFLLFIITYELLYI